MEGDIGKTPGKRQRSINSTGSERTPEYKRQLTVSQNRYATLENQESDSDSSNASGAEKENDTPKITTSPPPSKVHLSFFHTFLFSYSCFLYHSHTHIAYFEPHRFPSSVPKPHLVQ